jgi:hypothetical protein
MGRPPLTIQDMQKTARDRGGRCVSKRYSGPGHKLLWECAEGHQWEAQPEQVRYGGWCPVCGYENMAKTRKLGIQEMREIAKTRRGRCLSIEYVNAGAKLLWQCVKGHKWEAVPGQVKNGSWCPHCAGNARLTIEDMKDVAGKRGGRCISVVYRNNHTKLLWECAAGHRWEAIPMNIRAGSWCPVCARGK